MLSCFDPDRCSQCGSCAWVSLAGQVHPGVPSDPCISHGCLPTGMSEEQPGTVYFTTIAMHAILMPRKEVGLSAFEGSCRVKVCLSREGELVNLMTTGLWRKCVIWVSHSQQNSLEGQLASLSCRVGVDTFYVTAMRGS